MFYEKRNLDISRYTDNNAPSTLHAGALSNLFDWFPNNYTSNQIFNVTVRT